MGLSHSYFKRICKSIKDRGLIKTFRLVYYEKFLYFKIKIKAGGVKDLNRLGVISENILHGVRYEAVNYFIFKSIFSKIDWPYKNSVFIDFGSGMGAALRMAKEYGFKKIIGIEFSPVLAINSLKNLKYFNDIKIVYGDAVNFKIPDEANVFFFFNPFTDIILKKVLFNIEVSLATKQRKVLIVYINALYKDVIDEFGYEPIYAESTDELNLYQGGIYSYTK
jgi:hypothetical protein